MEKITVAQIIEHQKQADALSEQAREVRKARDKEISHLEWDVYRDKIRAIEQERDNAIARTKRQLDSTIADIELQITEQFALVIQAERIISFLQVDDSQDLTIPDNDIKLSQYSEQYQEALGYLYDGHYLKVKAFIIGNRKPKNKYSLIVVGKSIFPESIIKYPYSYGMDISNWGRYFALQQVIKDSNSIAELKAYYEKRKDTILTDTIIEYEKVANEYQEIKQTYKVEDFTELITWRCPQCNNFYTVFDSFAVHYTPLCYKHDPYINMVKQEAING